MSQVSGHDQRSGQFPTWLNALLLLDAFALGGLVATRLIVQTLESMATQLVSGNAQAEIQNVLDHLLPYWLGYPVIALLLIWITVGAFLWLKTRWRMVIAATCVVPLVLLLSFLVARG